MGSLDLRLPLLVLRRKNSLMILLCNLLCYHLRWFLCSIHFLFHCALAFITLLNISHQAAVSSSVSPRMNAGLQGLSLSAFTEEFVVINLVLGPILNTTSKKLKSSEQNSDANLHTVATDDGNFFSKRKPRVTANSVTVVANADQQPRYNTRDVSQTSVAFLKCIQFYSFIGSVKSQTDL